MISYLLRFLVLLFIFFFLKRLLSGLFRLGRAPRPGSGQNSDTFNKAIVKRDQVEKDPVCGMFVAREAAVVLESGGETRYFCSEECRKKFLELHQE